MEKEIYQNDIKGIRIIESSVYKDIKYYITTLGSHPCVYVEAKNLIKNKVEEFCHCGISYQGF